MVYVDINLMPSPATSELSINIRGLSIILPALGFLTEQAVSRFSNLLLNRINTRQSLRRSFPIDLTGSLNNSVANDFSATKPERVPCRTPSS